MKLFSSDGSLAVVAVGDAPIGIFAIGQFARGFICIGQVAVGVIVLGQAVASVWGIGQVGIGVGWFGGMLGLGGRGLCLRLIPGMDPPRDPPAEIAFQSLFQGVPEGFVRAQLLETPRGTRIAQNGQPLSIKMTPKVAWAISNARTEKVSELYAHMKMVGRTAVCDSVMEIPGARATYGMGLQIFRVLMLIVIATFWWWDMTVPSFS